MPPMGWFGKLLIVGFLMALASLIGGMTFSAGVVMTSPAMEPAIPEGAKAFVNYSTANLKNLKRGQVVLVRVPGEETVLVRRVMAFGGETIEINQSVVLVNGTRVDEPWLHAPNTEPRIENPLPDYYPSTSVSGDDVFVLADIRKGTRDSRQFGPVKREAIIGKVWTLFGMTF